MSLGVLKGLFGRLREASSATPATPDGKAGVAAKPAPVLGCTPATPATPEFREVDKQSANNAALGPDRWCWPRDPSPDAAMNCGEIGLFVRRHARMLALGLTDGEADKLAERLKVRDREGDCRVSCAECLHARAGVCSGGHPLRLATLHHCSQLSRAPGLI